ncbi:amidohydrolase family protein [Pseudolabrys sp.]|uniref:amidohydrolase family protein n=1 Tax=Pseudolabrys sp. TaxID=1960880 RepID=UPI003D0DFB3B
MNEGSPLDIVLRRGRIHGSDHQRPMDIGIRADRIVEVAPSISADAREIDLGGRLVCAGFIETHIHLDKACILGRCGHSESLAHAIAKVSALKRDFTQDDVYARGRRVLEKALIQGTTRMRTHVEVDPRVGLRAFDAISRLRKDYAWAIDLEICVFPQEGLLNDPGTDDLLVEALEGGADVIGGCPYTDTDPNGQIARIFELAERYDVDIDFHLDFDLDPSSMDLYEVCRQTEKHRRGGRVAIGHVSKLSAAPPPVLQQATEMLRSCGVAVTVLPATDLFLMGHGKTHSVPRGVAPAHRLLQQGVTCSISTNNVMNPFTPFGDCSLLRMANLYANIQQVGQEKEMALCFEMVTSQSARLMNLKDYGIRVGAAADLVVLDAETPEAAVAELAQPLLGLKAGRETFKRPPPIVLHPVSGERTVIRDGQDFPAHRQDDRSVKDQISLV